MSEINNTVVVYDLEEVVNVPKSIEQQLYWYDIEKKEMLKFVGSSLSFKYKYDDSLDKPKYRLLPEVVQEGRLEPTKQIDKKAILNWFDKYQNYNHTKARIISQSSVGRNFEVPQQEIDQFTYDLQRNGFRFEVH